MIVFPSIGTVRNVTNTLSKIFLLLAIIIYLFSVFADFEGGYRKLKVTTFILCIERNQVLENEDIEVVLKQAPHEL